MAEPTPAVPDAILTPVDGSDCSDRALQYAAMLARQFDAALHVVHVTDRESEAATEVLDQARAVLDEVGATAEPELVFEAERSFARGGRVGQCLLTEVDERGIDLVVIGHHGAGRLEQAMIGSVAKTVMNDGRVPVTVVS